MAHFAQVDENNIVQRVTVVPNEQEHRALEHLTQDLGLEGNWIQCSYNTILGEHKNGGTPLRGNYPGQGWVYDPVLDAFFQPKPFPSWVKDTEKYIWVAPVPEPEQPGWEWDEESLSWKVIVREEE
jgi:hypothetical protein